jgi:hypothetical protein
MHGNRDCSDGLFVGSLRVAGIGPRPSREESAARGLADRGSHLPPIKKGRYIMSNPFRVEMPGPLSMFAAGFFDDLLRRGYRPGTAAKQLQAMSHLSRWIAAVMSGRAI